MPLIASSIPNLVGGVSQQPAALRLTTSCEDSQNAWLSVVSGLQKRPPTKHIANIGGIADNAAGYMIERNEGYRYLAIVENGSIKVLDLNTGTFQTVNTPDGTGYLSTSSPVDAFRFVTVGDYTFIANREVTVTTSAVAEPASSLRTLNPTTLGSLYVTVSAANSYYSIFVNSLLVAAVKTPTGSSGVAIPDTGIIAQKLEELLRSSTPVNNGSGGYAYDSGTGMDIWSTGPRYNTVRHGSTITIVPPDLVQTGSLSASDVLQTQGGSGDKNLRTFRYDLQSFSDLPPTSPDGRIVRIAGDLEQLGDDYYVIFDKGVWRETFDWDNGEQFDVDTMPHVLVRETNGTWTFREHTWGSRTVGDTESSQNPSFVSRNINDLFVFSNRLGVLSDENIVLSETDNYENFYRTTAAQVLDSDPLDIAVLHNNVDILYHAVPYNRDLLMMSDKNQFRLSFQNYLGPTTINVQYRTAFNVSTRVKPMNVGNSVYFMDDRTDYTFSKLYEYFPTDNATQDDASDVSASIPEFITKSIRFTAASNRSKVVLINSEDDPSSLFVYKFFWSGDKKAQSSWTKWTFEDCDKIYWAGFSGIYLYMLVDRPNGASLERMRIDEDVFDTSFNYDMLLDRGYQLQSGDMSYDSNLDITTITLPYSTTADADVVSIDTVNNVAGIRHQVTRINDSEISVDGDITGYTNHIGIPYEFLHQFSTLYAKQQKGQGEVPILDSRIQLRYVTLEYHDTAYFTTEVKHIGRNDAVVNVSTGLFSGAVIGSQSSSLGVQPFSSGRFRIPVMAENIKARIYLKNDSPFPCAFGSAEWQAIISPTSVQRM